ncbi:MAG: hypothetical protein KA314_00650 [Chloroflexi bacterium]|nr:hypothetical protein [Chloroflexota bacterium]MBP8054315.1 hypothetical protein [Chloroflexota bacterium]
MQLYRRILPSTPEPTSAPMTPSTNTESFLPYKWLSHLRMMFKPPAAAPEPMISWKVEGQEWSSQPKQK